MHPIERLRFVARATDVSEAVLVRETAGALASFADDPSALVTAARRIVARQPESALLHWFCSLVLTSPEPGAQIWDALGALEADRSAAVLADELVADAVVVVLDDATECAHALSRRGDVQVRAIDAGVLPLGPSVTECCRARGVEVERVAMHALVPALEGAHVALVEPTAAAAASLIAPLGSATLATVASARAVPVWAVLGTGRVMANAAWPGFAERCAHDPPWDSGLEELSVGLIDEVVRGTGRSRPDDVLSVPDAPFAAELLRPGVV